MEKKSPETVITTSGMRSKEPDGTKLVLDMLNNNMTVLRFDHNHPDDIDDIASSVGDRVVIDEILQKNPNSKVGLHFKEGHKWDYRSITGEDKNFYHGEY